MSSNRLKDARERVVSDTQDEAREQGLDATQASNAAFDLATQDTRLIELCNIADGLASYERRFRDAADRREKANVLNAGINIDDAIEARADELVDEAIEQARAAAIDEVTA